LPRAAALSDAERGGLSTFRESQATAEQIRPVAEDLVRKARVRDEKAGIFGILKLHCETVRAFQVDDNDGRSYCVYDTGILEIPSHAEIFQRVSNIEDAIRDDRRNKLFGLVKNTFVPVDDFMDGFLSDLRPRQ
jgi:hypothetical protein